jgi:membrane glycosyltransferase
VLSTVLFATQSNIVPTYFTEPNQLFPAWPIANFKLMLTLFGLTAVLLLAPKVISLAIILRRGQAPQYGGAAKLLLSALLEFIHSVLLAPVRMLFHTQFVLAALTGVKLNWKSPPREDSATGWGEAFRRHVLHSLFALAWIGAILASAATFQWWLSPVLAGLLVAIPLSAWTSRSGPGRWLRRHRVFVIPEELHQPPVLAEADRYAAGFGAEARLVDAVGDAAVHAAVVRALPQRPPASGVKAAAQAALVEQAANAGPGDLSNAQGLRLLADAHTLAALRERVLAGSAHDGWAVHDTPAVAPAAESPEPASQQSIAVAH